MSWNYRILRKHEGVFGETYSIVEVYYEEGKPVSYANSSLKDWEFLEDLTGTYKLMQDAIDKPILDESIFYPVKEK